MFSAGTQAQRSAGGSSRLFDGCIAAASSGERNEKRLANPVYAAGVIWFFLCHRLLLWRDGLVGIHRN